MQSESEQSLKYKSVKMKGNCLLPIVHWHDTSHVILKSCAPVLLRSHLPYPPSDPSPCHLDFLVDGPRDLDLLPFLTEAVVVRSGYSSRSPLCLARCTNCCPSNSGR